MILRVITWLLLGVLSLIPITFVVALILLRTDIGHRALLAVALPRLEASTGLKVKYTSIGGAWPDRVFIKGLVLSDDRGVWFEAKSLALDWNAAELLGDRIDILYAQVDGGNYARDPVIRGSAAPASSKPSSIPRTDIHALQLKRFHVGAAVFDQELMLDLSGDLALRQGDTVRARINANVDTPGDISSFVKSLAGSGLTVQATLGGNIRNALAVTGLVAKTRDGRLSINGSASYDLRSHSIAADVGAMASPELAPVIWHDLSTTKPFALSANLSGQIGNLAIRATTSFKDAKIDTRPLGAFTASAKVLRTRTAIAGPFNVRFLKPDNSLQGTAGGTLNYETTGRVQVTNLSIAYGGATLKGAVDLVAEPLSGDIQFEASAPNLAALPLPSDIAGSLKTNGRIHIAQSAFEIDAAATSDHLSTAGVELDNLAAKTSGTLDNLAVQISFDELSNAAIGTLKSANIAGAVSIKKTVTTVRVDQASMMLADEPLKLAHPMTFTSAPNRLSLDQLDVAWGGDGHIFASASRQGANLKANVRIANFEPPEVPTMVSGTIDVDTGRKLPGTLDLKLVQTASANSHVEMELTGTWDGKRAMLGAALEGTGKEAATFKRIEPLRVSLPLVLSTNNSISVSTRGPIDGRLAYKGPITPFAALLPLPQQTVTGTAIFDLSVAGTLDNPVFGGTAALKDASYEHTTAGVVLDHMNLDGRIAKSAAGYALSVDLSASDGMKHPAGVVPLKLKGDVALGHGAPSIDATITLDNGRLVHMETVTAIASGKISLSGSLPNLSAQGALTLQSVEINIPESVPSDAVKIKVVPLDALGNPIIPPTAPVAANAPINIAIDVALSAPDSIVIKGRGLDSTWGGNLKVGGTANDPTLDGVLAVRRGNFDFSGRRFELTRGTVGFAPAHSNDPDLQIEAQYTDPSTNTVITINVVGPASSPRITLSSDPSQPQEDIMSLVLFGKPAKDLSAFEAVQTANALAQLTGKGLIPGTGGPGILDRARSMLGLDLLSVSLGASGSVSVGKYVQKNIYVSASQGLAGQPGTVSVTVDISKSLSVKSTIGQDSNEGVGVFWKRDY